MKKRVFAAIDISDEIRFKTANYINILRGQFPKVRASWDKPEKLHLTLKFLGEINDEKFTDLNETAKIAARKISAFSLQISETGVFPSKRNARVLWLGVNDTSGKLRRLRETFETECEKRGFPKEKREFKAHLTIARLKENSIDLVETHLRQNFSPVEFKANEIVIYQSELKPEGSIYSIISKHKLS